MIPKLVPDAIRINARPELRLRSGDFVSIKVIKRIVGSKYAVALQGRVIPAFSRLDLAPGRTLKVLVSRMGDRFELRIVEGSGGKQDHLLELLRREGLGTDTATAAVVAAMMKSGLAVRASTLDRIKGLLRRLRLEPGKFARLIAMIIDKKLDLSDAALERLVGLLGYGDRGGEEESAAERRRRGKRERHGARKQLAELLRSAVAREDPGEGNLLQLINHLRGSRESWVLIPYGFRYLDGGEGGGGNFELRGILRLRYDTYSRALNRLVLTAETGGRSWGFLLCAEREPLRLTVFASRPPQVPEDLVAWQNLVTNLQNLGVEVDDTIREDTGFDGFSLPWEETPYQSVNTQG